MSQDQFWVNPDGLANSADGFHEKAASVSHLLGRINDLSSSDRAEIVGLDSQGQGVWKQLQDSSAELQKGLAQWREGIHGAGDAVVQSAKVFGVTEDNNEKLASRLADPNAVQHAAELKRQLSDTPRESTPRIGVEQPREPGERRLAVRSENPAHLLMGRVEAGAELGQPRERLLGSRVEAEQPRDRLEARLAVRSENPAHLKVGVADGVPDVTQPRPMMARSHDIASPEGDIQPAQMMMGLREEGTPLGATTERALEVQPDAAPADGFSASEAGVPLFQGRVVEDTLAPVMPALPSTEVMPRVYEAQEFSPLEPAEFASQGRLEQEQYSPVLPAIPAEHVAAQLDPMLPISPALPLVPAEPRVLDES